MREGTEGEKPIENERKRERTREKYIHRQFPRALARVRLTFFMFLLCKYKNVIFLYLTILLSYLCYYSAALLCFVHFGLIFICAEQQIVFWSFDFCYVLNYHLNLQDEPSTHSVHSSGNNYDKIVRNGKKHVQFPSFSPGAFQHFYLIFIFHTRL